MSDQPSGRRPDSDEPERSYPAQDVRQGEIILRTPLRRWIFIGGLAGFVILAVIAALWSAY